MKTTVSLFGMLLALLVSCTTSTEPGGQGSENAAGSSDQKQRIAIACPDVLMHPEYARTMARMSYIWGYAMVNTMNRKNSFASLPGPCILGAVPAAPPEHLAMLADYIDPAQNGITCTNQDVVYGGGYFDLDAQPVVLQVPDVDDRFWIYSIYDARTDQVGHLGRPYDTKPGFYLLTGPGWNGKVPEGITEVIKSPTSLASTAPRFFMNDTEEDRNKIQTILNQVMAYPLSEFTGKMKTTEWKKLRVVKMPNTSGGEVKWVVPEKFLDQLPEVLKTVPPLPGEEALYAQFDAFLKVLEKDPGLKKIAVEEIVKVDTTLIRDFLQWKYNGKPAGNGWNRSVHNAEWGYDYFNRTGTARSNMFDNRPGETQYFYTDNSSKGEKLTGKNNFKILFKAGELPPVMGFWSLTLYNENHFFYQNTLKRYSLGTKNKTLKYGSDGSLTIWAGNKNPGAGRESNWLPAPESEFSLYIRAYWGKEGITEGTWVPPVIEKY
jgi:hypothetical protein